MAARRSFASERAEQAWSSLSLSSVLPATVAGGANSAHFDFFRRRQQKQNRLDSFPLRSLARSRGSGDGPATTSARGRVFAHVPTYPPRGMPIRRSRESLHTDA